MRREIKVWSFSAMAVLGLSACDPTVTRTAPATSPKEGKAPAQEVVHRSAAVLSDEDWVLQVLQKLSDDPAKSFSFEILNRPENQDFSAWMKESLLAADVGAPSSEDISVELKNLARGESSLRIWFSEEFTREVFRAPTARAGRDETQEGVFVPISGPATQLVSAQCREEPEVLCAFVLRVDWAEKELSGFLVLISSLEQTEGEIPVSAFAADRGQVSLTPVVTLSAYLAKAQAAEEAEFQNLVQVCSMDPLSDESCGQALGVDGAALQDLVMNLCSRGAAEGVTLEQCQPQFEQYCSELSSHPDPEMQAQNCESMARAGFLLEESVVDDADEAAEELQQDDELGTDEEFYEDL